MPVVPETAEETAAAQFLTLGLAGGVDTTLKAKHSTIQFHQRSGVLITSGIRSKTQKTFREFLIGHGRIIPISRHRTVSQLGLRVITTTYQKVTL